MPVGGSFVAGVEPHIAVRVGPRMECLDLEAAYREHAAAVYGIARMLVGSAAAEDVTQEVFIRLWHRPELFDATRGSLRTYLLTLAHHRSVEVVRSETARSRRQQRIARDSLLQTQYAHDVLDAYFDADLVAAALRELVPSVRAAIVTAFFGELTYREVAVALDEPEGTIKSRIRKGLSQVRAILQDLESVNVPDSQTG